MREHLEGFSRFLRILKGLAESSVKGYCKKINEFCTWLERQAVPNSPCDITRQDIEAYLEWCFYRGNANVTRLTKLIALQNFFRYLVYAGVIKQDPTADIPKPIVRWKFVQKFTKNEVLRFFHQVDITTEKGLRDAVILILAVFCGLRVSEITNLNLNDIVTNNDGTLDFNIIDTKHHGNRSTYLWKVPSALVTQYLTVRLTQQGKGSDPFIISYTKGGNPIGNRLTACAIDVLIKKLAQKADIRKPQITMHMFRATHINDLRHIKGYDLPAIAERVGHKHISTTDRYIPRRDRIHRTYASLHEYWREFAHIWKTGF